MAHKLCGARTRSGAPCKGWGSAKNGRCRMHGGTNPGAPKGNTNGLKHGRYSAAEIARRRHVRELLREARAAARHAARG